MNYNAFLIRNLTNMHVGSGDNNFGTVDKLVQRDTITNYPSIYSSSLKGALREFFSSNSSDSKKAGNQQMIIDIFGGEEKIEDKKNGNTSKKTKRGNYRFFQANLIGIPVRSNNRPYYMATTPSLIEGFINTLDIFNIDKNTINSFNTIKALAEIEPDDNQVLIRDNATARIEDWDSKQCDNENILEITELTGPNIAVFSEKNFKQLTKYLPVIARNYLENGQSTNLWYEEVVPRETRFYCIIGYGENYTQDFETLLSNNSVQIGANASIGYGFTEFKKLNGGSK